MRESFKVNEQEYRIIQQLKKINEKMQNKQELTEEEYLFLLPKEEYSTLKSAKLRETQQNKEQMQYQRKTQLARNNLKIKQWKREVEFKETEIKDKKLLETHEGFVDKVKPSFFLQNEIDDLNQKISELEEQNKYIEEERDKAEKEERNVHRN